MVVENILLQGICGLGVGKRLNIGWSERVKTMVLGKQKIIISRDVTFIEAYDMPCVD